MKKLIILLYTFAFALSAHANERISSNISIKHAKGNVYMLTGPGGNVGLLATEKGLLLVDDKYQRLAAEIEAAMKSVTDKKLKYVVNTHYHGDHTGSNQFFSHHAPIFAHQNVRERLSKNEKLSADSLPVVTYEQGINIYLGNEHIQLTHLPDGHTDSDTIVYFKQANVLHTGDLFFEIGFPYIDFNGGGTLKGYLKNVRFMIQHFPDDVTIISGHGKLSDMDGLKAFADMIEYSIKRVNSAIDAGKSEADILAMGIGEQYEHLSWSFITEDKWLKALIRGLK